MRSRHPGRKANAAPPAPSPTGWKSSTQPVQRVGDELPPRERLEGVARGSRRPPSEYPGEIRGHQPVPHLATAPSPRRTPLCRSEADAAPDRPAALIETRGISAAGWHVSGPASAGSRPCARRESAAGPTSRSRGDSRVGRPRLSRNASSAAPSAAASARPGHVFSSGMVAITPIQRRASRVDVAQRRRPRRETRQRILPRRRFVDQLGIEHQVGGGAQRRFACRIGRVAAAVGQHHVHRHRLAVRRRHAPSASASGLADVPHAAVARQRRLVDGQDDRLRSARAAADRARNMQS